MLHAYLEGFTAGTAADALPLPKALIHDLFAQLRESFRHSVLDRPLQSTDLSVEIIHVYRHIAALRSVAVFSKTMLGSSITNELSSVALSYHVLMLNRRPAKSVEHLIA